MNKKEREEVEKIINRYIKDVGLAMQRFANEILTKFAVKPNKTKGKIQDG